MAQPWAELWTRVIKVEQYGKWGYGVVKLLEVELGDVKAESDDVASAKVSSDLAGVLADLEQFELLCANMRQTDIKDEAEKYKDQRTVMIEKLCQPMEKSINDLQTIKTKLGERLGRINQAAAYEHLNSDVMPVVESDGASLGEIRATLHARINSFNDVFNRAGFSKGGEVDGQSALGSVCFDLLRNFEQACVDESQMLDQLVKGKTCDPIAAQAREDNKMRLSEELHAALGVAEEAYLTLIHAGKRFLDVEKESHEGVERPSLFESTRSMLAMEGASIVKSNEHRTLHGTNQLLELLGRRLESLRSIPVLRREADNHLKDTKKADKTIKKLLVKLKHYEDHKRHIEAYAEISSGSDGVSDDDEFHQHPKLGNSEGDHGQTLASIQAKISSIRDDISKWEGRAAAGREKLTSLVPALPELRFLSQLLQMDQSSVNLTMGSMSPIPPSPGASLTLSPQPGARAAGGLGSVPAFASTSPLLTGGSSPTKEQIVQHRLELEARKKKLEEQLEEIQSKF